LGSHKLLVGDSTSAAHVLDRAGYGTEISPGYCDVVLRRIAHLTGEEPVLVETGASVTQVAAERGVTQSATTNGPERTSK
jgi:hypothetical protein